MLTVTIFMLVLDVFCFDENSLVEVLKLVIGADGFSVSSRCYRGKCLSSVAGLDLSIVGVKRCSFIKRVLGLCDCLPFIAPPQLLRGVSGFGGNLSSSGIGVKFVGVDGTTIVLPLEAFWRHVGIFGSTGSGKSTTAAYIISQLVDLGVDVLVLDWHGEYEKLLRNLGVSSTVIGLEGFPEVALLSEAMPLDLSIDVVVEGLGLSIHQASLFYDIVRVFVECIREGSEQYCGKALECLDSGKIDCFVEFIELVWLQRSRYEHAASKSRAEVEVWAALIRRLKMLALEPYAKLFRIKSSNMLTFLKLMKGITVLRVSDILSLQVRRLYSLLLLRSIFDYAISRGNLRLVIVVEEAHNLASRGSSVIPSLLAEARKYGIGMIIVEQTPSLLDPQTLYNINTVIIHRLHGYSEIKCVSSFLGISARSLSAKLSSLGVGEAILASALLERPAVIRIELPGVQDLV